MAHRPSPAPCLAGSLPTGRTVPGRSSGAPRVQSGVEPAPRADSPSGQYFLIRAPGSPPQGVSACAGKGPGGRPRDAGLENAENPSVHGTIQPGGGALLAWLGDVPEGEGEYGPGAYRAVGREWSPPAFGVAVPPSFAPGSVLCLARAEADGTSAGRFPDTSLYPIDYARLGAAAHRLRTGLGWVGAAAVTAYGEGSAGMPSFRMLPRTPSDPATPVRPDECGP